MNNEFFSDQQFYYDSNNSLLNYFIFTDYKDLNINQ